MSYVLRPLMQWPRWRHHHSTFFNLIIRRSSPKYNSYTNRLFSPSVRNIHFRPRASKITETRAPSLADESDDESSSDEGSVKKSRNEKKRDARRSVQWAMELANFSPSQIKRILGIAEMEENVYEAIKVVKGLGRDVREGRRRQFSYIGRLLRDAEPKLMEELIQATKDGDQSIFQSSTEKPNIVNEDDEEVSEEEDDEDDFITTDMATRWCDGLINKDTSVTSEIYSLREVEFDRQELRQLVRKVHSTLASEASSEGNEKQDKIAKSAVRSLNRFLRNLVKQLRAAC